MTRSRVSSGCRSKYESNEVGTFYIVTRCWQETSLPSSVRGFFKGTFREIKNSNDSIDTMMTNFPRLLWEKRRTLDDFSSSMLARNVKKKKQEKREERRGKKWRREREREKKLGGEKWFFACTSTVMRESFLILSRVKLLRAKDESVICIIENCALASKEKKRENIHESPFWLEKEFMRYAYNTFFSTGAK